MTSAFKEYGVRLSWFYCDNSYITSCASDVSLLLVCTAPHPQITCRHCSNINIKFSVAPMYKSAVQSGSPSAVLYHMGVLASCRAAAAPLSHQLVGWIHLYHASAHSPTCRSSRQVTSSCSHSCCSVECSCKLRMWARQYTGIHGAFQGIHGSAKTLGK